MEIKLNTNLSKALAFSILIVLVFAVSCSTPPKKELFGRWKPDSIDVSQNILSRFEAEKIDSIKESILGGYWQINKDATFSVKFKGDKSVKGDWELGPKGEVLLMKNESQSFMSEVKIKKLDSLSLVTEEEGGTIIFYKKISEN